MIRKCSSCYRRLPVFFVNSTCSTESAAHRLQGPCGLTSSQSFVDSGRRTTLHLIILCPNCRCPSSRSSRRCISPGKMIIVDSVAHCNRLCFRGRISSSLKFAVQPTHRCATREKHNGLALHQALVRCSILCATAVSVHSQTPIPLSFLMSPDVWRRAQTWEDLAKCPPACFVWLAQFHRHLLNCTIDVSASCTHKSHETAHNLPVRP